MSYTDLALRVVFFVQAFLAALCLLVAVTGMIAHRSWSYRHRETIECACWFAFSAMGSATVLLVREFL